MFLHRSIVFDHLRKYCGQNGSTLVLAFYFKYKEANDLSSASVIASLLKQRLEYCGGNKLPPDISSLFEKNSSEKTRPIFPELLHALTASLIGYSKVFLIFDAADECPQPIWDVLTHHFDYFKDNTHILITSRYAKDRKYKEAETITISAAEEDIYKMVENMMLTCHTLSDALEASRDILPKVQRDITAKSQGM